MSFKSRNISCFECNMTGQIADWEFCENYVCVGCGLIHTIVGADVSKCGRIDITSGITPFIPLGSKIQWSNDVFLVAGFSIKADEQNYKWHEYVAINNKGVHIHISQFNGHWNVIETVDDPLLEKLKGTGLLEKTFPVWNRYKARTVSAIGSFPFDVKKWKSYKVVEHVLPPHILIEETSGETIKYLGTYITHKELQKKTDQAITLPYRIGVGANQLFSKKLDPTHWWIASGIFLALLIILDWGFNSAAANKMVLDKNYIVTDSSQKMSIITESFELEPALSAMKFTTSSDVNNDWIELGIELVNEKNNESRSFIMGMEYYSGVEDGYAWSEGHSRSKEFLCSVPQGKYHLLITPLKSKTPGHVKVRLTVEDDVPYSKDILILILIMIGISVIVSVYKFFFEKSRWNNSPYSPYSIE